MKSKINFKVLSFIVYSNHEKSFNFARVYSFDYAEEALFSPSWSPRVSHFPVLDSVFNTVSNHLDRNVSFILTIFILIYSARVVQEVCVELHLHRGW